MARLRRVAPLAAIVLVLASIPQVACAQTGPSATFEARLARRIAEDHLVSTLLGRDRRFPFFVAEPKEWSIDVRLALGLVVSASPQILAEKVKDLQFDLERALDVEATLAEKPSAVDNILTIASNAASAEAKMGAKWRDFQEGEELERNDLLTTIEQANQIVEIAAQLRASKGWHAQRGDGPAFETVLSRVTAQLLSAIGRSPELVKPLREVPPISDRLQKSRARVKALLDQATKVAGRRGQ